MSIQKTGSGDNRRYVVRWRDREGEHKKSFRRKMDAENFEKAVVAQLRDGTYIPPRRAEMPYGQWVAQHWWPSVISSGLRQKTVVSYEGLLNNHVLPAFEIMRLGEIRMIDVENWLGKLRQKGYSADTVRLAKVVLSKSLESAVRSKMIQSNPCLGIKTPKSPARSLALTPEQVESLIEAVPGHYRNLFRLLAYYGLRPGEAIALRVADLDDLGQLRIDKSLSEVRGTLIETATKTDKARVIPLDRDMVEVLRDQVEVNGLRPEDRIFYGPNGGEIRLSNLRRKVLRPAVIRAGLPDGTTTYTLRHTAASIMASVGVAPVKAAAILGHSPTQFLNTYAHAYPSDLKDVTDFLAANRANLSDENVLPFRRSAE